MTKYQTRQFSRLHDAVLIVKRHLIVFPGQAETRHCRKIPQWNVTSTNALLTVNGMAEISHHDLFAKKYFTEYPQLTPAI